MMILRDVLDRYEQRELSRLEAAELLGIDEWMFRRWCRRYEDDSEANLIDRRLEKASPKRVRTAEKRRVGQLYLERNHDFPDKHFH